MRTFIISVIVFGMAIFTTSCANLFSQANSIKYAEKCSVAERNGRLDIAEKACFRSLVDVDKGDLGDAQRSIRMYDLARIKRKLGKLDAAEKLYKDSLKIEEKQPQPSEEKIGRRLSELAIIYAQKDQIQSGLPYVEKLYPIADIYKGRERTTVAAIFYAYSLELDKHEMGDVAQKLSDKAVEMGFDPKNLGK